MLRASAIAERTGIPSVSIISAPFKAQAAVVAKGVGMPSLPLAEYPGIPMMDDSETVRAKVERLIEPIIAGLATPARMSGGAASEPAPRDVIFRGTLDDVQEFFYRNLWTDGLPIIPPTAARVDRFLAATQRKPDEVIGRLLPENRAATVWSIAVNGVMAGCRPEYMPVLIAIVQAMTEPVFRVQDAGSTPGWEPLVILSGPVIRELDLNCGQGVMRAGRQANSSIGRFVRLYLRNVAGLRIPPGAGDKGSIAGNFNVALAEDESSTREMGWTTFGADQGFAPDESVVTLQSVVAITAPIYTAGARSLDHIEVIADIFGGANAHWSFVGMKYGRWDPLLVLGPSIAAVIAHDGWSKDDLRRHLYERVTISAREAERYVYHVGGTTFTLRDAVKAGLLPQRYAESDDPQRRVPVFVEPERIGILVAGDPGRNQSKGYINNHIQGGRVSKRISP